MLAVLTGCAGVSSKQQLLEIANRGAFSSTWQSFTVTSDDISVQGLIKPGTLTSGTIPRIYIEGDGHAWINRYRPSTDPTPKKPVALELALKDPAKPVAYIARPCQYGGLDQPGCKPALWTRERFSPKVIRVMDQAVNHIKKQLGAKKLDLIGYSGGGAIAAILAAQRNDIDTLTTVAGLLDHDYWTKRHQVQPLSGSINPIDLAHKLKIRRQIHWIGANDKVISKQQAQRFVAASKQVENHIETMGDQGHDCCRPEVWKRLLKQY